MEELLHLGIVGVVHLDGHGLASPLLDLPGAVFQVSEGPSGDVDGRPGSS